MKRKYPVITLCGSTRFKDEFMQVQKELTLKGYIGTSTWSEICYARMLQKPIEFMCPIDETLIDENLKEHMQRAEQLAWQQLDSIRHSNGYYNINDYVHFTHKHKIIVDPWINVDAHYNGTPWTSHDDSEYSVNPFEYYGCEKVAGFIEEILMKSGDINE